MSNLLEKVRKKITFLRHKTQVNQKKTGFIIGNTTKSLNPKAYFVPYRETPLMVTCGAIVYSEHDAMEIAKAVDGEVDYILVDAEKKIADVDSTSGAPGNIERAVRDVVFKSKLRTFKGNDLSVDAADLLLTKIFEKETSGIGGKIITILGCGNLGTKLALKLVERGANVRVTRRNHTLSKSIADVLNIIKPEYTTSCVTAYDCNHKACTGADVIIGATQGHPVIMQSMLKIIAKSTIIIDIGKGSIEKSMVPKLIEQGNIIYRLDIASAIAGVITSMFAIDASFEGAMGRKKMGEKFFVAGGMMGQRGDIVVDSIVNPKEVYGIADGAGDFLQDSKSLQLEDT